MKPLYLVLIVAAAACGSPRRDEYDRVSRAANPILAILRPSALRMAIPGRSHRRVGICLGGRALIAALAEIDFGSELISSGAQETVGDVAHYLADPWLRSECQAPARSEYVCLRRCEQLWTALARDVEQLRYCASQHDIEIVSLGGKRDPEQRCPSTD